MPQPGARGPDFGRRVARRKLGSLAITIEIDADGNVDASHQTTLSPSLREMQGAMSGAEKAAAVALRRKACEAVAAFFLFVNNPDARTRVG